MTEARKYISDDKVLNASQMDLITFLSTYQMETALKTLAQLIYQSNMTIYLKAKKKELYQLDKIPAQATAIPDALYSFAEMLCDAGAAKANPLNRGKDLNIFMGWSLTDDKSI